MKDALGSKNDDFPNINAQSVSIEAVVVATAFLYNVARNLSAQTIIENEVPGVRFPEAPRANVTLEIIFRDCSIKHRGVSYNSHLPYKQQNKV